MMRIRIGNIYSVKFQTQETSAKTISGRCRRGHLEILGEPIAMVTRRRRLEWFGHVKEIKQKTSEQLMKMEGKFPGGRPRLRWRDTGRRDKKAWKIREQ